MLKISVVINTLNEEKGIRRVINSVKWADELLICDMYSEDKTAEIAQKMGAKVIFHKKVQYVELVRNFAISQAKGDWILVLDPDEEVPESLKNKLIAISSGMKQIDYVRIPRKNLIFKKWMQAAMWWPDYNIRFFKKGKVSWSDRIHRPPAASGLGLDLPAKEQWVIIHHHYETISQFLERMNRYTNVQAIELKKDGYLFDWRDLIKKPLGEFMARFFANKGYEDGVHGLTLSLLQAFSHLCLYLKLWEIEGFKEGKMNFDEVKLISKQSGSEINYWLKYGNLSKNPFKNFVQRIKNKI